MSTAAQIREHRVRSGRSEVELAQLAAAGIECYGDRESQDNELVSTLTLAPATRLASSLARSLRKSLSGDPSKRHGIAFAGRISCPASVPRSRGFASPNGYRIRVQPGQVPEELSLCVATTASVLVITGGGGENTQVPPVPRALQ